MKLTVGVFSLDDGDQITAPLDYMRARGWALLEQMATGEDAAFEKLLDAATPAEHATLHRLNEDYNQWLAQQR